jgi:phosphoglycerate dehydrogenase-like enzyme
MTVVLVPNRRGVEAMSDLPVRAVRYDPRGELPAEAAEAEILVTPFLADEAALALPGRLPKLKLVQILTAGAEAWLPRLPAGVALSDGKGAHGGATAEWVVGALLAVYREFPAFVRAQERGEWARRATDGLLGKRVLVVGAGDLGEHVVRRLTPFDVRTTLVGRRARDGVHGVDEVHGLLPEHDAVVLVVPETDETRGLVDARFLAAMPDGAVLVNAARGPVVDTDALLAELTAERLRAALDVTDPEPLPQGHPLWGAPGLFLTPHVGGGAPGGLDRAMRVAREQIAAYVRGEEPPNLVKDGY